MLKEHPTDGDTMLSPQAQGFLILLIIGSIAWGVYTQNYMVGLGMVMAIATFVVLYDLFKPIVSGLVNFIKKRF